MIIPIKQILLEAIQNITKNITVYGEALVMKHTKIYNPIIKKVHLNSNGLELFMPSNLGNEYYKHFDKHETKYR